MTSETKKTAIDLRPLVVSGTDEVLNAEGRIVALCMRGISEDPFIAYTIVRAVNNHDALVEMIERLIVSSDAEVADDAQELLSRVAI